LKPANETISFPGCCDVYDQATCKFPALQIVEDDSEDSSPSAAAAEEEPQQEEEPVTEAPKVISRGKVRGRGRPTAAAKSEEAGDKKTSA
jgi:hypothetical protein